MTSALVQTTPTAHTTSYYLPPRLGPYFTTAIMSSSRPPRRYAAVPQSSISVTPGQSPAGSYYTRKPVPSAPSSQMSHNAQAQSQNSHQNSHQRGEMARSVATGAIGAGFGPYSVGSRFATIVLYETLIFFIVQPTKQPKYRAPAPLQQ